MEYLWTYMKSLKSVLIKISLPIRADLHRKYHANELLSITTNKVYKPLKIIASFGIFYI